MPRPLRRQSALQGRGEPLAMMPDREYGRNGCYSGSAVGVEGRLTLCYTGNVKFEDGSRTAWQCLAVPGNARRCFPPPGIARRCGC